MQRLLEAASIALQAIWASKLRSLLTILGNVVAVASIIAVVSLVQGLNANVEDLIQSQFAADSFTVTRNPQIFNTTQERRVLSNPLVSEFDAQAIRRLSPSVAMVMAEARSSGQVKFRDVTVDSVSIRGVTREYNDLPATAIGVGRPISGFEFDTGRQVAVLGWDTADKLFGPLDPIGKTITLRGTHFRVVGVAPERGSILGQSQDEFAIVPLPALRRLFGGRLGLTLTVRPTSPDLVATAIEETRVALRVERRLRPADPDNFGIASADTFLDIYTQVTAWIFAILIGVVSLSLVVGGIVIMNIMLMVVTERTREIGLRKSLGARRRDVLWQILTESVTLSLFGGLVGMLIGFLAAWIISQVSPLPMIVEAWSVALGVTVTAAVGLFFGLYPAMRAAALDPIEALRRE